MKNMNFTHYILRYTIRSKISKRYKKTGQCEWNETDERKQMS